MGLAWTRLVSIMVPLALSLDDGLARTLDPASAGPSRTGTEPRIQAHIEPHARRGTTRQRLATRG